MPLQNRVTPFGALEALPGRGLIMGNRGILHDDHRRIVRPWQVRRWIACVLEFRGRRRVVMTPHRYTELFFLDEATSFSAGHRPCAECRREDFLRFRELWVLCHGGTGRVDEIDAQLHGERIEARRRKRVYREDVARLPNGVFVAIDGAAHLLWSGALHAWSDAGYTASRPRPKRATVEVLTPPSTVAVFEAGFVPAVHPSTTGKA